MQSFFFGKVQLYFCNLWEHLFIAIAGLKIVRNILER